MNSSATMDTPRLSTPPRAHPHRPLVLTFGSVLEPDGGLQVRTRVLAESLASLGCPPAIVSTREPRSDPAAHGWLRSLDVPSRTSRVRFLMDLVRLTRRAASACDLVIISDATLLPVLAAARVSLPLIWDTNECQSLHYSRMQKSAQAMSKRLAWVMLERWAGRRCAVAVAIGEREAAHWNRLHPGLRGKIVTVDHAPVAQLRATGSRMELERRLGQPMKGPILVFTGTMAAKHNGPAARWIIDVLAPSLADSATVLICGAGTEKLRPKRHGARVCCLGLVDDVDMVIAAADLCLAPLASGAGVKTKVLHYLAHGRRVVGTPIAFEGLSGAPGLIEATLESMPAVVASLIEQDEPRESARQRAAAQRSWMERQHGRQRIINQWQETLRCI